MEWLSDFPGQEELLSKYKEVGSGIPLKVNNHIHTPHSFSAFSSVEEAVKLAADEGVSILGINDFYVTEGYSDFISSCRDHRVFPLLNIELIGINGDWQKQGLRVNDPNNPGRTYLSGKGLKYPVTIPAHLEERLSMVIAESNNQVSEMVDRLNGWLSLQSVELRLSMEELFEKHAVSLVRERHIARALRLEVEAQAESDSEYIALLEKIYGGRRSEKSRNDISGVEEELRTRLLKSGGPAFVPEDEKAFLPLVNIIEIIRKSGGIPAYPMLLDGTGGAVTAFESDKDQLLGYLEELGISTLEFIPSRNSFEMLKEYSEWFYEKGLTVTFGTEHNTSAMSPLTVSCKGGVPLDESLMNISYKGAACIAAHQYLVAKEELDQKRFGRREMEELGAAVMNHYYNKSIF